jgi:uncharacterized membrane protein
MTMRIVHTINIALLLALIGLSLNAFPDLPERIPLHFGSGGEPDRWGDRTLLSWLLLPLIAAGTVVLLYGVGAFIPSRPQSFNVPDKQKLLALPPHLQRWVMSGVVNMLHVLALTMLVMFCGLQYGAWESAHTGEASGVLMGSVAFSLVVTPFLTIGMLVVTQRRLDAAWRAFQEEGEAAGIPR